MKKILVVLLILAVTAGSAFAEWSFSTKGEIGAVVDLTNADKNGAMIGASEYWNWDGWGDGGGHFGMTYNWDNGLSLSLGFGQDRTAGGSINYNGDGFAFQAESDLENIWGSPNQFGRLWGWYKLMDGMITIEGALDSRDTNYWRATSVVGIFSDVVMQGANAPGFNPAGDGFTKVDHNTYLLLDFAPMDGLNVGFMMPEFFANNGRASWANFGNWGPSPGGWPGDHPLGAGSDYSQAVDFESVFKMTRIGLQYTGMEGLNVSLQVVPNITMTDILGLDLAATYRVTPEISVEAGFQGLIGYGGDEEYNDGVTGAFALRVNYNDGPIGAYFRGGMNFTTYKHPITGADQDPTIAIGVGGSYQLVPTHLLFTLDFLMYINEQRIREDFMYGIVPQLFFNFMGTGAGTYWNWGTGMIVRYHYVNDGSSSNRSAVSNHTLDFTFRWAL